jgi:hypothetical protein
MRTRTGLILLAAGAGLFALLLPATVTAAPDTNATVCNGSLAPGTYHAIVVPDGATCDLGVGPVTVHGGIRVGHDGTLMLGFEGGPNTGTINGGIVAINAAQVQVHNAVITGGANVQGGPGPTFSCSQPFAPFCFTDFEDDAINGGATINKYDGFWLGFLRNSVNGNAVITNNNQSNDEIDLGSNTVHGNLICANNTPLENTGDSPGGPDTVTGHNTCHEGPPQTG